MMMMEWVDAEGCDGGPMEIEDTTATPMDLTALLFNTARMPCAVVL